MTMASVPRRLVAECLGTGMLVCTVVGSGIMADDLTDDTALALLGNTIPTGAILFVLITVLGPVSGAHFNPVVSMVSSLKGDMPWVLAIFYTVAQILGGVSGTVVAHGMFELPVVSFSGKRRAGASQFLAEVVAAFGLLMTILAGVKQREEAVPSLVGLYITAAYWFTASTSFANPAVAIARSFSDTFAGIRPVDVPLFVVAEITGALLGLALCTWLFHDPDSSKSVTVRLEGGRPVRGGGSPAGGTGGAVERSEGLVAVKGEEEEGIEIETMNGTVDTFI
uniref:Aquaporin n=1 Tax=Rhizochromulina marina TaxID=1034831 RepID=A0A7S2R646_9STRA|mmetsp:Transcript_11682/g.33729  ORF Transcript_11682/g.33729 Transcript_11682/m.33729 type:complete len:281 (+) Transcript_11682:288-1130(+)|eukprot:CAMPEP_0118974396 /NCGR_PEP_ID=MMETSP1173-20130426/11282_1 /TAXON_ID=1034831 /ORGANISM="Rhizochromulina marina cf, Strain CCMP1243" /LENGTH=280 /DNA_ID=CAMNT_0006924119 /DNA_START=76 /DNA_END=918 /DNA_ORIENTATION=-